MNLRSSDAVVTAGDSGIGLVTAREFIELGAMVVITGRRHGVELFAGGGLPHV